MLILLLICFSKNLSARWFVSISVVLFFSPLAIPSQREANFLPNQERITGNYALIMMILSTVLLYCWLGNLSGRGGWPEYRKEAPVIVVIFLLLYFSMRQISIASLRSLFSFQKAVTSLLPYIWWAFGGIHESVSRLWYTMSWCYLKCLLLSLPFLHPEPPLFYYRQSLNSTLCFSFWDLPIGMTIQPITRDAGDRGPLQIYAAGGYAGHCTEPFVHGQFCIRVFCQKCRNIIADANFQGKKATAFSTKTRCSNSYGATALSFIWKGFSEYKY